MVRKAIGMRTSLVGSHGLADNAVVEVSLAQGDSVHSQIEPGPVQCDGQRIVVECPCLAKKVYCAVNPGVERACVKSVCGGIAGGE